MQKKRIVLTGLGIISALGHSPQETWRAIEEEKSGLGPLTLFPSPGCDFYPVGEVKGDLPSISGLVEGSRSDHLAVFAAREAFQDARLDSLLAEERKKVGIVLGATTGGMRDSEEFLQGLIKDNRLDTRLIKYHQCSSSTKAIAQNLETFGFRSTISTACSSGNMAISTACDAIESGDATIMLAGGVDSLTRLTLNGFASLLVMDPKGCRPFDANRQGMSLGEGAGVVVLETLESARKRGAKIYGSIAGRASTCDAFHPAAPEGEGSGIYRAMELALKNAGLAPGDVDYINAHGTATRDNDKAESKALQKLFGENLPLISSTKRFFGHTLAAAGAVETILCILALHHGKAPVNLGLQQVDPEFGFTPMEKTTEAVLQVALNNSIGFGGNNCSLVICKGEAEK